MPLRYTQMPLDRCSGQRKDSAWLAAHFEHASARFTVARSGRNLVDGGGQPVFVQRQALTSLRLEDAVLLGIGEQGPVFIVDAASLSQTEQSALASSCSFGELWKTGAGLGAQEAAILGFGNSIMHWHDNHRYCGRCGYPTRSQEGGHSRVCTAPVCGHRTFPRTDPAVIVLVEHTDDDGVARCLLGRQKSWPQGVVSTLAGFVDPGESLEEAVAREVLEEAGVEIESMRYFASQPWPFPASVMLGFVAVAHSAHIRVDHDELEHAQWFSREQLSQFGEWGDEGSEYKKSRRDSISRALVDWWQAQT